MFFSHHDWPSSGREAPGMCLECLDPALTWFVSHHLVQAKIDQPQWYVLLIALVSSC